VARLSFNASFGGVLLAGHLAVDDRGTRFWPGSGGARFDQRREPSASRSLCRPS